MFVYKKKINVESKAIMIIMLMSISLYVSQTERTNCFRMQEPESNIMKSQIAIKWYSEFVLDASDFFIRYYFSVKCTWYNK